MDKVDLSRLLSADRKILTKILSDQSGNLWVTGYYPSSFIISFLPNEVLPLSMEGVKQNLGVIASPMQFSQEKIIIGSGKRNWDYMLMIPREIVYLLLRMTGSSLFL